MHMHSIRSGALVLLSCLASGIQSTEAGPATYRDGELQLERSIVAGPAGDMYYADISLRENPDGSLGLVRARKRRLALLDELELDIVYSDPVEVGLGISGHKSMPCAALEPVATARSGNVFHVLVAEAPPDPLALCAQHAEPFTLMLRLDSGGLSPGDYMVLVNNEAMGFTIEDLHDDE